MAIFPPAQSGVSLYSEKKQQSQDFTNLTQKDSSIPTTVFPLGFFFFFSGCTWSSLLCTGVLYVQWAEATLLCGALALGTQASVAAAQGLFSTVSAVVGHGLSCSRARGTFPGQGSNPYPMHWQADSHALYHQQSLNFHWSSQYYSLC